MPGEILLPVPSDWIKSRNTVVSRMFLEIKLRLKEKSA